MSVMMQFPVDYDDQITDPGNLAALFSRILDEADQDDPDRLGEREVGYGTVTVRDDWRSAGLLVDLVAIDAPLFKKQRELVGVIADPDRSPLSDEDQDLAAGLEQLLDVMADQLHDNYQVDCLLTPSEDEEDDDEEVDFDEEEDEEEESEEA